MKKCVLLIFATLFSNMPILAQGENQGAPASFQRGRDHYRRFGTGYAFSPIYSATGNIIDSQSMPIDAIGKYFTDLKSIDQIKQLTTEDLFIIKRCAQYCKPEYKRNGDEMLELALNTCNAKFMRFFIYGQQHWQAITITSLIGLIFGITGQTLISRYHKPSKVLTLKQTNANTKKRNSKLSQASKLSIGITIASALCLGVGLALHASQLWVEPMLLNEPVAGDLMKSSHPDYEAYNAYRERRHLRSQPAQ